MQNKCKTDKTISNLLTDSKRGQGVNASVARHINPGSTSAAWHRSSASKLEKGAGLGLSSLLIVDWFLPPDCTECVSFHCEV